MTKFLLAIRKAYDTKRTAFVIAFCAVAVFLYFAPFCLDGLSHFVRLLYIRQSSILWGQLQSSGDITNAEVAYSYFLFITPLPLFLLSVCGAIVSKKTNWCIALSLPLAVFSVYAASSTISTSNRMFILTPAEAAYSAFYIIIALLVILVVTIILVAAYMPLKEPAPTEPKPKKPRKLTKAERITELEERVRELEKNQTSETKSVSDD